MDPHPKPEQDDSFSEVEEVQDYFAPGVDVDDIAPLWILKEKYPLLDAFTTLFRGEPTGVIVRLHVLSEVSLHLADTPSWGIVELRQHFAYLTDTAFETVMRRLRRGGLISYDREDNSYTVTPLGLQVNSAISYFLKEYEDEGLGLLTGIVYAGEAMGNLSQDALAHLLNRLGQLEEELMSAINSASEPAIIKARERFETVWKRVEQGTDVIRRIAQNQDMDRDTHKLGQKVAYAQSRLTRVTSVFQRAMNDIDRQRIHIGSSGISTSDLNNYLMNRTIDDMQGLLKGSIGKPVQPLLLLSDLLADVAEFEIVERHREEKEEWKIPELVHSPTEESIIEEDVPHLSELITDIAGLNEETVLLKNVVPKESFEVSSYRLSILSLKENRPDSRAEGLLAGLLRLPAEVYIEDGTEEVMKHGVLTISKGAIIRRVDDSSR